MFFYTILQVSGSLKWASELRDRISTSMTNFKHIEHPYVLFLYYGRFILIIVTFIVIIQQEIQGEMLCFISDFH